MAFDLVETIFPYFFVVVFVLVVVLVLVKLYQECRYGSSDWSYQPMPGTNEYQPFGHHHRRGLHRHRLLSTSEDDGFLI